MGRNFLNPALMQAQNTVAMTRKVKIVGNDEGSKPVLVMKFLDQIENQSGGAIVQVAGGLICHQDLGCRNQRPG